MTPNRGTPEDAEKNQGERLSRRAMLFRIKAKLAAQNLRETKTNASLALQRRKRKTLWAIGGGRCYAIVKDRLRWTGLGCQKFIQGRAGNGQPGVPGTS